MKILSLKIETPNETEVQMVKFKTSGLTLIYGDIMKPEDKSSTINSLGKTLFLKMVDYIYGANNDSKIMKKEIQGYKLIANVKYKKSIFKVERIITDDSDSNIFVNGESKSLTEYKDFFNLSRTKLDKQILLSNKNSEISPRERASQNDIESILQLLNLNELNEKVSVIYELQDNLKQLSKNSKEIERNFSKYLKEEEKLEEKIFIIDKSVQELQANLEQITMRISSLDTMEFKEQALIDYEELNIRYKQLKNLTLQQVSEKSRLNKYLLEIKDVQITKEQLRKIFYKAKFEIPDMVIKKVGEVEQFHNSVVTDRINNIKKNIIKLDLLIAKNNSQLEEFSNEISKLSQILAENKAYQEALSIYSGYNNRLNELLYQQGQLSQAKEVNKKIERANDDLVDAFIEAKNLLQDETNQSLILKYREFVYDLVKNIYSSDIITFFGINIRDKHKTRRPLEFVLKMTGETGEGISEVKKNLIDYLVFYFNTETEVLLHDSSCYNGIDPRQVSNMLLELNRLALEKNKQAIVAINKYQLDNDQENQIYTLIDREYGLQLHEESKLMKIDF